ncbi:MAG: HlyD family efflux transporter periplasmic adaptor subunit [Magnetospirillum sp. WYHS-4]
MAAALSATKHPPLPHLREDVALFQGCDDTAGAPTWLLYDPLRHRYFRIDRLGFEMLARWGEGEGRKLLRKVREQTFLLPQEEDLSTLIAFLRRNCLVDVQGPSAAAAFLEIRNAGREKWYSWLLHRYLFIRVPILRPQRLLDAVAPWVAPLYSPAALWSLVLLTLTGLYLAGRQWETFVSTFTAFGTWEGQVALAVGLAVSKLLHEFGHALTLHRFGGRVPTMGVAFLVMLPVLYTDTSDSWRLRSRRRRLAVGAAGMAAELGLAGLALLLWSFAPDGGAKGALFVLATTVWVATLSINASPFMRFDGYYILSDYLDIPNLQDRAFALARWHLREFLFGLGEAPPERFPMGRRRMLLAYAYATWLYRLVLFLGIALLVYHFFFKLLGIILFGVEIWYFVTRPIALELRRWWTRRERLRWTPASFRSLVLLACLIAGLAFPWRATVSVPAVLNAAGRMEVFPPVPARIEEILVPPEGTVAEGQAIYRLASPTLRFELEQATHELALARILQDQVAVTRDRAQDTGVARQEMIRLDAKIRGIESRMALLTLAGAFDGRLADVPDFLRPGLWVNESTSLGVVVADGGATLTAYAQQEDLEALEAGADVTFFPDDPLGRALSGRVGEISPVATEQLADRLLASVHGGPVDVLRGEDGALRSVAAIYRITAAFSDRTVARQTRGVARIDGVPRSLLSRFLRGAAVALVRESGF